MTASDIAVDNHALRK